MNTVFLLLAEFEKPLVPLSDICERYFSCNPNTARDRATAGKLPVPAFRTGDSQKAPYMVDIRDLAEFIDKQRSNAKEMQIPYRS